MLGSFPPFLFKLYISCLKKREGKTPTPTSTFHTNPSISHSSIDMHYMLEVPLCLSPNSTAPLRLALTLTTLSLRESLQPRPSPLRLALRL